MADRDSYEEGSYGRRGRMSREDRRDHEARMALREARGRQGRDRDQGRYGSGAYDDDEDRMRGYYGRSRRSEGGTLADDDYRGDDYGGGDYRGSDYDLGLGGGPGRGRIGGGMGDVSSHQYRRSGDEERYADRQMGRGRQGRDESAYDGPTGRFASEDRVSHRGKGPKNYARSDERITEEVSDRLSDDHDVDASEISVRVESREVTLDGTVSSRREKRIAEDVAHDVSGVAHVQNNLRIQDGSSTEDRSDAAKA